MDNLSSRPGDFKRYHAQVSVALRTLIHTNGELISASDALCEFYAGYLEIDVFDANEFRIANLPFADCTVFEELHGKSLVFDDASESMQQLFAAIAVVATVNGLSLIHI